MNKYEIYQVGKLPPLTVVEADYYRIEDEFIMFYRENKEKNIFKVVASFVLNNIAGVKILFDK